MSNVSPLRISRMSKLCFIFVFLTLANLEISAKTSSAIPELLIDCYKLNSTQKNKPPFTIPVLVELLRKIEIYEENALNMRLFSSSLLHGVIFDGVIRSGQDDSVNNDFAIPYRATSHKFYKYRLLVDYLIPGKSELLQTEALTREELCFLHEMLSNTVDIWERGDETETCSGSKTKLPENYRYSRLSKRSSCPIQKGNIITQWGTISIGHIIKAVSAVLQKNSATFETVYRSTGVNASNERPKLNWDINTLWVSTIAADLAEAILNQISEKPIIGNGGHWNNLILPQFYYLNESIWDFTESEIIAGIDAIIIGENINNWLNTLQSTTLSQIIDMYYSTRGICYDLNIKASNRSLLFKMLMEKVNLTEQVLGTSQLLQQIGPYDRAVTEENLKGIATSQLIEHFQKVVEMAIKKYDHAEYIPRKQMNANVELIVILDGAFDLYESSQILYALAESTQVSYHGSQIGIINGENGNWISNVSDSIFQMFSSMNNASNSWPTQLLLSRSLETIVTYYQNKTNTNCSSYLNKPKGQSILLLANRARLTNTDIAKSKGILASIKGIFPETNVLYVIPKESRENFAEITNLYKNDFIIDVVDDLQNLVIQISDKLNKINGSIVSYCTDSQIRMEDYISPHVETVYEINEDYLRRSSITTKFKGNDYGDISVCATSDISQVNRICKYITVNDEITFESSQLCPAESSCSLQFIVNANNSKFKCAENDCKYPDQIRLSVTSSKNSGSVAFLKSQLFLIMSLILSSIFS